MMSNFHFVFIALVIKFWQLMSVVGWEIGQIEKGTIKSKQSKMRMSENADELRAKRNRARKMSNAERMKRMVCSCFEWIWWEKLEEKKEETGEKLMRWVDKLTEKDTPTSNNKTGWDENNNFFRFVFEILCIFLYNFIVFGLNRVQLNECVTYKWAMRSE
jgi:hypothetical protein